MFEITKIGTLYKYSSSERSGPRHFQLVTSSFLEAFENRQIPVSCPKPLPLDREHMLGIQQNSQ
jgi:hypothetical protein